LFDALLKHLLYLMYSHCSIILGFLFFFQVLFYFLVQVTYGEPVQYAQCHEPSCGRRYHVSIFDKGMGSNCLGLGCHNVCLRCYGKVASPVAPDGMSRMVYCSNCLRSGDVLCEKCKEPISRTRDYSNCKMCWIAAHHTECAPGEHSPIKMLHSFMFVLLFFMLTSAIYTTQVVRSAAQDAGRPPTSARHGRKGRLCWTRPVHRPRSALTQLRASNMLYRHSSKHMRRSRYRSKPKRRPRPSSMCSSRQYTLNMSKQLSRNISWKYLGTKKKSGHFHIF